MTEAEYQAKLRADDNRLYETWEREAKVRAQAARAKRRAKKKAKHEKSGR